MFGLAEDRKEHAQLGRASSRQNIQRCLIESLEQRKESVGEQRVRNSAFDRVGSAKDDVPSIAGCFVGRGGEKTCLANTTFARDDERAPASLLRIAKNRRKLIQLRGPAD